MGRNEVYSVRQERAFFFFFFWIFLEMFGLVSFFLWRGMLGKWGRRFDFSSRLMKNRAPGRMTSCFTLPFPTYLPTLSTSQPASHSVGFSIYLPI